MKLLALVSLASLAAACSSNAPAPDGGSADGPALEAGPGSDAAGDLPAGSDGAPAADASIATDGAPAADASIATDGARDGAAASSDGLVLGGLPPAPAEVVTTRKLCTPPSSWVALPYTVAQAAYSRPQELMILLPDRDRALHLFDPVTCDDRRIPLARSGLSVSVHPDGKRAVVGHDGYLTTVDLAAGTTRVQPVPRPATDVALLADGTVRLLSHTDHTGNATLTVVRADGTLSTGNPIYPDGRLRRSPDGQALFWLQEAGRTSTADDFGRVDLTSDRRVSGGPYDSCHELFFTDDSQRLITACRTVRQLTSDPVTDQREVATLEGERPLLSFDSVVGKGQAVAIETAVYYPGEEETSVQVYDPTTWKRKRAIRLPSFIVTSAISGMNDTRRARGRQVFVRGDGSRYHVLATSSKNGLEQPTDAVATLAADGPDDPALPPLMAPPEPDAFLPPFVTVPAKEVPLDVDMVEAGFSRLLNRLVIASANPENAVVLLDPETGAREAIPLPRRPRHVFVREDGAVAAVVHDGGLQLLELMTRKVLFSGAQVPRKVSFGTPPLVVFDDGPNLIYFDLQAGAVTGKGYIGDFPPIPFTAGGASVYLQPYPRNAIERYEPGSPGKNTASYDLNLFDVENTLLGCAQDMWVSRGGEFLVIGCARVFKLSTDASQDLAYLGSLDRYDTTLDTIYSKRLDRFVSGVRSHPREGGRWSGIGLAIHEPRALALEHRVSWPSASSMGSVHDVFEAASGRFYLLAWDESRATRPTVVVGLDL
jgi:hypothetical protein